MQIPKKTIEEFIGLIKRKEGREISDKEAMDIVTNLLLTFNAIYRPIPKKDDSDKIKIGKT